MHGMRDWPQGGATARPVHDTRAEHRAGYERDKFRLWVDADGDCRDTRDAVLAAESLVPVRGCDNQVGRWRSYYDGVVTRRSTTFDISVTRRDFPEEGFQRVRAGVAPGGGHHPRRDPNPARGPTVPRSWTFPFPTHP